MNTKWEWYSDSRNEMVRQKREPRIKRLRANRYEDKNNYKRIWKECKKKIIRCKTDWAEGKMKELETQYKYRNSKVA